MPRCGPTPKWPIWGGEGAEWTSAERAFERAVACASAGGTGSDVGVPGVMLGVIQAGCGGGVAATGIIAMGPQFNAKKYQADGAVDGFDWGRNGAKAMP